MQVASLSVVFWALGSVLMNIVWSERVFTSEQRSLLSMFTLSPPREPRKTLALLYPPGLIGGYRNQFLRFMSLLSYGIHRDIEQLFLPSLLWSTKIKGKWRPIPMDWVFDVDYWNTFDSLPTLVKNVDGKSDCWVEGMKLWSHQHLQNMTLAHTEDGSKSPALGTLQRALVQGGTFQSLSDIILPIFLAKSSQNLRKTDHLPLVANCTNPLVYGGGTKAGRLWNDFMRISKTETNTTWWGDVYRALRPAPRWRELVERTCFRGHHFVALHARVEIEMLMHTCGVDMERNLTQIVTMVQDTFGNDREILVAVSRADMVTQHADFVDISQSNLQFLDAATHKGTVYECGAAVLGEYYKEREGRQVPVADHGSLLESVINFYAAISAEVFVGVQGSSYSNDVWTTRYWMGKEEQNYRYTNQGTILRVEGLPKPHSNCKRKPRKKQTTT